jgi:hypothetical protein
MLCLRVGQYRRFVWHDILGVASPPQPARWFLIAGFLLLSGFPAFAAPVWAEDGLYGARAYVTGTRAETRQEGILTAFRRVLIKVSGNPALADDDRVALLEPLATSMVEDIAYQDRMSDQPHHDEQGTRDRPFDLAVQFDPQRIDAALTLLGEQPWAGPRPRLMVRAVIKDRGAVFPLSADGETDERHREALIAAADRFGMRVVLAPLEGAAPVVGVPLVTLAGEVVWDDAQFGWVAEWRLDGLGATRRWEIGGVSFDDAYRVGVSGALAVLSGHELTIKNPN